MAKKQADKKPDAKAPEAPKVSKPDAPVAKAPEKKGCAWAEKAATADEAKKLGLKHAGMKKPKALVIDKKAKAKALALIAEHKDLQAIVVNARNLHKGTDAFKAARANVKAKKREINVLYAEAADSVQAAEDEFAAQA